MNTQISDNVLPFAKPVLQTEGEGSPPNWLKDLPEGTRFLARFKGTLDFSLGDFTVASPILGGKCVTLALYDPKEGLTFAFYDTYNFSKRMELYLNLGLRPNQEITNESDPASSSDSAHNDDAERDH